MELAEDREEGMVAGMAKGRAEGIEKGRAEGILQTALAMKAEGIDPSTISKITKLSLDDISRLTAVEESDT